MIKKEKIKQFIKQIPPASKALKTTIMFLNNGELTKAAAIAQSEPALKAYLIDVVNKPIYGFRNKVSEVSQIFGILGVSSSQQTLYNYMMTLLSPSKWVVFKLNKSKFYELQTRLSVKWKKILKFLDIDDKDIESAITLLPASIIVAEALFNDKKDDVEMLRSIHDLDFNTISLRLTGFDLFDISKEIAQKWEMSQTIIDITQASSGIKPSQNKEINLLGKWMHLLLFYELSQSIFVEAGINDFLEFNVEYVSEIYDDFEKLMEIS